MLDDVTVACEMKGRIEGMAPSVSGIANKLKSVAKRQLPSDRPSVLFVRIPHSWVTTRRFGAMADAGLRRVFNDYHRLNSVVFHWEEWRPLEPLGAIRITRFRPYHNPMPRLPLATFETALKAWPQEGGSWLSMERIACEEGDVVLAEGLSTALQISEELKRGSVPTLGVAVAYKGSLGSGHHPAMARGAYASETQEKPDDPKEITRSPSVDVSPCS